ncbi:MAG: hypothetical protein RL885_23515, partial [Planctomycetota bacterium]
MNTTRWTLIVLIALSLVAAVALLSLGREPSDLSPAEPSRVESTKAGNRGLPALPRSRAEEESTSQENTDIDVEAELLDCVVDGEVAAHLEAWAESTSIGQEIIEADWSVVDPCCDLIPMAVGTGSCELHRRILQAYRGESRGKACPDVVRAFEEALIHGRVCQELRARALSLVLHADPAAGNRLVAADPDLLGPMILASSALAEREAVSRALRASSAEEKQKWLSLLAYGHGYEVDALVSMALDPAENPNVVGTIVRVLSISAEGQRTGDVIESLITSGYEMSSLPAKSIGIVSWNLVSTVSRTEDVSEIIGVLRSTATANDSVRSHIALPLVEALRKLGPQLSESQRETLRQALPEVW